MQTTQLTACTHRWFLDEPHWGEVRGVCRRCGATRTYPADLDQPEAVKSYAELDAAPPSVDAKLTVEERAVA